MRQATLILILVGCATDELPEENGLAPLHDPEGFCPGGGADPGGGGADPHPIPAPRDCTEEASRELCLDCCHLPPRTPMRFLTAPLLAIR
jgi:hypothetical protein